MSSETTGSPGCAVARPGGSRRRCLPGNHRGRARPPVRERRNLAPADVSRHQVGAAPTRRRVAAEARSGGDNQCAAGQARRYLLYFYRPCESRSLTLTAAVVSLASLVARGEAPSTAVADGRGAALHSVSRVRPAASLRRRVRTEAVPVQRTRHELALGSRLDLRSIGNLGIPPFVIAIGAHGHGRAFLRTCPQPGSTVAIGRFGMS